MLASRPDALIRRRSRLLEGVLDLGQITYFEASDAAGESLKARLARPETMRERRLLLLRWVQRVACSATVIDLIPSVRVAGRRQGPCGTWP
jgi:hypothetical protein